MTIESEEVIKTMLTHDGTYPGDPQMSSIWSYKDTNNKQLFAVFTEEQYNDIFYSPYVFHPILLWRKDEGLTRAGREFLK